MKKAEFEQEDLKWLEERMYKESEDIEVPESLAPERMLEKLKGVQQKRANTGWYKYAAIAASIALFGGVCWQAGRDSGNGKGTAVMVAENTQVTKQPVTTLSSESNLVTPETVKKNNKKDDVSDTVTTHKGENHTSKHEKKKVNKLDSINETDDKEVVVCEARSFVEGDAKRTVTDGNIIFSGEGNDVVVQEYASDQINEIKRLSINEEAQAFYLNDDSLVCIASDKGSNTTIYTYNVESYSEPLEVSTISVDGTYQCSYQEKDDIYVFTSNGKMQKINMETQESSTMDVGETDSKYYVSGETIYAFKQSGDKTRIQSFHVEENSLKEAESVECAVSFKKVVAVSGEGEELKLLGAEEDGIRMLQFDEQMRLVDDKKNSLGQNVFAADFTSDGILVMGNEKANVTLSMLKQDTLETKDTTCIEDVETVSIGDLSLTDDASKFGFMACHENSQANTYYVYDYSNNGGFKEIKTKQVETGKVENEFAVGNSVLLADTDGIEVLVK